MRVVSAAVCYGMRGGSRKRCVSREHDTAQRLKARRKCSNTHLLIKHRVILNVDAMAAPLHEQ